jgi:hypothetical protein
MLTCARDSAREGVQPVKLSVKKVYVLWNGSYRKL